MSMFVEQFFADVGAVRAMQSSVVERIDEAAARMSASLHGVEQLLVRDRASFPTLHPSVLVLDDDLNAANTVVRALKLELPAYLRNLTGASSWAFKVSAEHNVEVARHRVKVEGVSVVVADYYLENAGISGASFLRSLDRAHRGVLVSGMAAVEELRELGRAANAQVFRRPVTEGEWQAFIAHVATLLAAP